jgi:hypothetical protein
MLLDFHYLLVFLRQELRSFLFESLQVIKPFFGMLQSLMLVVSFLLEQLDHRVGVAVAHLCCYHLFSFSFHLT